MELVMPIGVSGSGKSRLYKEKYSDYKKVCPDDIRYDLTGDISDQSRNKDVFRIADQMIDKYVRSGENVFYDATNLNTKLRKRFTERYRGVENVKITYVVLPADVELSHKRIQKDLENQVNRSKVSYEVLQRQMEMYKDSVDSGFEGENVQEIIYLDE